MRLAGTLMSNIDCAAWIVDKFNHLKIRTKLSLCLAIPFLSMVMFAGSAILVQYQQLTHTVKTDAFITFSSEAIGLINHLQNERGLTSGYLANPSHKARTKLEKQQQATDVQRQHFHSQLNRNNIPGRYPSLRQQLSELELSLKHIEGFRHDFTGSPLTTMFQRYTETINQILRLLQHIQNISTEGNMVRQSNSLLQLLWLQERAAQERGSLNGIFISGKLNNQQFQQLSAYLTEQQTYFNNFYTIATPDSIQQLKQLLAQPFIDDINRFRQSAIEKISRKEIINQLKSAIGYGGLIHHFKNYIIRGNPNDAEQVSAIYQQVVSHLERFQQQPALSPAEYQALKTIKQIFLTYTNHLPTIGRLRANNRTIEDIDHQVIVNDQPVLDAIELLQQDITNLDHSAWWPLASRRIKLIGQVAESIRQDINQQAHAQVRDSWWSLCFYLAMTLLTALLVIAFGHLLLKRLVGDVGEIASNIEAMQHSGNFDSQLVISGNDELTQLARSFNGMLEQRRQAEVNVRLAHSVFEYANDGIMVLNRNEQIEMVNPAFTRISGFSPAEAIGASPRLLSSGRHGPEFYRHMREKLHRDGVWEGEIWNKRKNDEIFPELLAISVIRDEHQQIDKYICLFSDITQRKQYEQHIWQQANYDPLTQLPNRKLFLDHLAHEIKTAKRNRDKLALLFIDLDRFKQINDTLGHKAGDELLVETAKRLNSSVRDSDIVARLAGDEFVIIAAGIKNILDVELIAEKVLSGLGLPFLLNGTYESMLSASIGISLYPDDGTDVSTLLKNSDIAMYRAKAQGRNSFKFFTEQMNEKIMAHVRIEQELQKAVQEQQFCLHYQPVVDIDTGLIVGAEALLRWQHPQRGLIYPDEFIQVAEDTGLINAIGEWVLRTAAEQAKAWNRSHRHFKIAVNVSGRQLISGPKNSLYNAIRQILEDTGLEAQYLQLELTETVLVDNSRETIACLQQLRNLGLDILLDDFGTGYSSLGYLKHYPINHLKIDRSFIKDVLNSREDACLVEAVLVLAQSLNLKVVAEGIEQPQHLKYLKSLGCEFGQGYLFAKPMPAPALEKLAWPPALAATASA